MWNPPKKPVFVAKRPLTKAEIYRKAAKKAARDGNEGLSITYGLIADKMECE